MTRSFPARLIAIYFLIGMLGFNAAAQTEMAISENLTLENAISLALKNQPLLRGAEARVSASHAGLRLAEANYFPSLNLQASGSRTEGAFVFNPSFPPRHQKYNSYATTFQAQQIVFDFGKTIYHVKANKRDVEASSFSMQSVRNQVAMNVQIAYFNAILAQRVARVNEETVQQAQSHLKEAEGFYAVGRRPQFDVINAQVGLANANVSLISARNQFRLYKVQLENAMGIHATNQYALVDTFMTESFTMSMDSVKALALARNPDFRAANAQLQSSRALVSAARSQHLPTLLASGSYNWNGFSFPLQSRWNAGLTLSLPLFQGFAVSAEVQQAEANMQAAEAAADQLKQTILQQVEQDYLSLNEAQERIAAAATLLIRAKENLRLAEARYKSGVGSAIEITDSRVALSNAQITQIQALYDYNASLTELRNALGTILPED